jgi:hypothetical protein
MHFAQPETAIAQLRPKDSADTLSTTVNIYYNNADYCRQQQSIGTNTTNHDSSSAADKSW